MEDNILDRTALIREEREERPVEEASFIKALDLKAEVSKGGSIALCTNGVNRPGLFFAGYEDYFAQSRVQVIGMAEMSFLLSLEGGKRRKVLDKFFSTDIPCLILSRSLTPLPEMREFAQKYNKPIYSTDKITSDFVGSLLFYLSELLAPSTQKHGVLADVFGTGVLITGDSGIGKSETALELVHRGHRLVTDDIVVLKNIDKAIIGSAPELIRHLMEIRGVGIIDVRAIYGVGSILNQKQVELLIELEKYDSEKVYERVGKELKEEEILGVKIPKLIIPVLEGRNIAIIIEVAVRDFALKRGGHNCAALLDERMRG
jgi:HPr kinase/phosphorylase